jgi:hypothetical protein
MGPMPDQNQQCCGADEAGCAEGEMIAIRPLQIITEPVRKRGSYGQCKKRSRRATHFATSLRP